jgi:hypothetical protein
VGATAAAKSKKKSRVSAAKKFGGVEEETGVPARAPMANTAFLGG